MSAANTTTPDQMLFRARDAANATILPAGEGPSENTAKGRREWDDRAGNAVNRVRTANLITFLSLGVAALAVFGYYEKETHFIPPSTIVRDRAGDIVAVVKAGDAAMPDDVQIGADLKRWVSNARSLYTDTNALKKGILDAYKPLRDGGQAVGVLNDYYSKTPADDPFKRAVSKIVLVKNATAVPIDSESAGTLRTFRVEWQEDTINRDGSLISSVAWWAAVTFTYAPPKTADEAEKAPDGIWITSFRWTPR